MKNKICPDCQGAGKRILYTELDPLLSNSQKDMSVVRCESCSGTGVSWRSIFRKSRTRD